MLYAMFNHNKPGWTFFAIKKMKQLTPIIAIALLFSANLLAQETAQKDPQTESRFKHNKHASVVFQKQSDYELKCDLYVPESESRRPVFIVIHGGAWTTGTKLAMLRHARILANRGYVVMSINYRLAPGHKWPAQIHDCKHAVRWIRKNADKYNADPNEVYAFGYSAGAHLALLLATTKPDDGLEGEADPTLKEYSSQIDGCIAGGSPCEFSWIDNDATTLAYWLGNPKSKIPEIYKAASPISWVTKDDPAIVLVHGTVDSLVPVSSPQAFYEKCQQENVLSELSIVTGGHAATFTRTTNLLNALKSFKSLLATQQSRRQREFLRSGYVAFKDAKKTYPATQKELATFLSEAKTTFSHPQPHSVPSPFIDPLTDKPFDIPWGQQWPKQAKQ